MTYLAALSKYSDDDWLDILKTSIYEREINGVTLPNFPSINVQEAIVGLSSEDGLDEAFKMYSLVKSRSESYGVPINPRTKILDFGCGWGRISRFFVKDIDASGIFGVDVDGDMIDMCHSLDSIGSFIKIGNEDNLPLPNNYFDVVFAYSVFTHLPRDLHILYLQEISRVLRPGGIIITTHQPRRFIQSLAQMSNNSPSAWHRGLSVYSHESERLLASYDNGQFVFLPTGGGPNLHRSRYGDAIAPLDFIREVWSKYLYIHEHIDNPDFIWQSVIVAQKLKPMASNLNMTKDQDISGFPVTICANENSAASHLAQAANYLAKAIALLAKNIENDSEILKDRNSSDVSLLKNRNLINNTKSRPDFANFSNDLTSNVRLPKHFYIDIGNYCNLKCPFCVTGNGTTKHTQGFMNLADFQKIAADISPYAELVSLYNWGEPFLNKEIFEIIACASKFSHVHIDSNFSFRDFTPDYADKIVASGLSTLFLSIDGATQETYEIYRVRGKLDRVFRNIRAVQEAKKRLNSQTPLMGWQFHVSRFNEHEMNTASNIANEMDIPIVFKRLSAPASWWSSLHFESDMVLHGGEWFNEAYAPPPNPDLSKVTLHENVNGPCRQLFGTMTIQWNGDVVPCTCVEGDEYTMGNVLRDGVSAVWNSQNFQKSRKFVLDYGPKQNGGSACECLDCPVSKKCLS